MIVNPLTSIEPHQQQQPEADQQQQQQQPSEECLSLCAFIGVMLCILCPHS
jgi:hypothetical protein